MAPRVGFEPTSPRFRRGAFTRSAFWANGPSSPCGLPPSPRLRRTGRAACRADASAEASAKAEASRREGGAGGGNRNRVFGVALRGLTFQLHPHRVVGSGGNRTSCRKGTAFTAQRRHQPSLLALPEIWRRAEGSNLCPCGPLGFRDRLPATPAALSGRNEWTRLRSASHGGGLRGLGWACGPKRLGAKAGASPRTRTWTRSVMSGQLFRLS